MAKPGKKGAERKLRCRYAKNWEMNCSIQEPRRDLGPADAEGLLKQLTKAILERALEAEMTNHLGYYKYSTEGKNCCNSSNGKSRKRLRGKRGEFEISVPRDRNAELEPQIIRQGQTPFDGFDSKIWSRYATGIMPQGLCHRDDGARATTPPSTDLRHISIAWANLNSYRCSHSGNRCE